MTAPSRLIDVASINLSNRSKVPTKDPAVYPLRFDPGLLISDTSHYIPASELEIVQMIIQKLGK